MSERQAPVRWEIREGDCIAAMAAMDEASVDAIVCDPPYNLSDSGKRDTDCIRTVFDKILLPNDAKRDTTEGKEGDLSIPGGSGTKLRSVDRTVGIGARVGVPKGAIDFKGTSVAQQEIKNGDESTSVADQILAFETNTERGEPCRDFVLKPTDAWNRPVCDATCSCFTEPSPGVVTVLVAAACLPGGDGPGDLLSRGWGRDTHIGSGYDTRRDSEGSSEIVVGSRAVVCAVLRLDFRGGTAQFSPANGTSEHFIPFELLSTQGIRADTRARRLPAVAQAHRIGQVGFVADRTAAFDLLVPHNLDHSRTHGGFMGKTWDGWESPAAFQRWCTAWAKEALRVLKPGGYLLAFGGTRTSHRLACAVEDAGFEIRDEVLSVFEATDAGRQFLASLTSEQIAALDKMGGGPLVWSYGSGFPKSLDVSRAIDKAGGSSPALEGNALRSRREGVGLSRAAIAELVGCSEASVRDWEEGRARERGRSVERIVPSPQYRKRLAEVLDYPEDERKVVDQRIDRRDDGTTYGLGHSGVEYGAATTDLAHKWEGWGTALKPAHEPIVMARKPLAGTVTGNVLAHGTGALNIDGCRIEFANETDIWKPEHHRQSSVGDGYCGINNGVEAVPGAGRWPANVALSHSSECVMVGYAGNDGRELVERWACVPGCPVQLLDDQSGALTSGTGAVKRATGADRNGNRSAAYGAESRPAGEEMISYGDTGGASRFFYCAKSSGAERNAGLEGRNNSHPTVKPIDLMRWLVRLVTPPGGQVLDPFAGSGTTGCAAVLEGFDFIGIEREADYIPIAEARIKFWAAHPTDLPIEKALASSRERTKSRDAGQEPLF